MDARQNPSLNRNEKDINDAKNEPRKRPRQDLTKIELEALNQPEKKE